MRSAVAAGPILPAEIEGKHRPQASGLFLWRGATSRRHFDDRPSRKSVHRRANETAFQRVDVMCSRRCGDQKNAVLRHEGPTRLTGRRRVVLPHAAILREDVRHAVRERRSASVAVAAIRDAEQARPRGVAKIVVVDVEAMDGRAKQELPRTVIPRQKAAAKELRVDLAPGPRRNQSGRPDAQQLRRSATAPLISPARVRTPLEW